MAAGIAATVDSKGDAFDCQQAESLNGLYKAEEIRHQEPWQHPMEVEFATLKRVH